MAQTKYRMRGGRTELSAALITGVTLLIIICHVVVFWILPCVIKERIKAEVALVTASPTWRKWKDPPYPIFIKFYVFNVSIPEEVQNQPFFHVKETGPYVWEEKRSRKILGISEENDTIRFQEVTHFYFRPDLSSGSEDDVVDIVNVPLISFAYILYKRLNYYLLFAANMLMSKLMENGQKSLLHRGVKVRDLLFDGITINSLYGNLAELAEIPLPSEFSNGRFALYNSKNGTYSPEMEVNRGIKDMTKLGKIVSFDEKSALTFWDDPYCDKINGSDGSMYSPFIRKDRTLFLFEHQICRSIYMDFVKEVEYKGIPAYSFKIPTRMFEQPSLELMNKCYAPSYGPDLSDVEYRGAYRIFTCKKDIPLLISNPHFHACSKGLLESVVGMEPNASLHETELIIEPQSGALLYAAKRIQVSLEYFPIPNIDGFEEVFRSAVPIVWIEETVEMDEKNLQDLRWRLIIPQNILHISQWIVGATAIVFVIFGFLITVKNYYCKKQAKPDSLDLEEVTAQREKSAVSLLNGNIKENIIY